MLCTAARDSRLTSVFLPSIPKSRDACTSYHSGKFATADALDRSDMLIYTRSAEPAPTSAIHHPPLPAPLATFQVEKLDQAHDLTSKLFQDT